MTTTIAPESKLEHLLQWFSQQEAIPLETRLQFFEHIQKTQQIDEKSAGFLEKSLHYLEGLYGIQAKNMEDQVSLLRSAQALEQNKEHSIKEYIVQSSSDSMMKFAESFKDEYTARKMTKNILSERSEESDEMSQVAALKASIS